ncbi:ABC1-domain-containing protein [Syncephalis pseudoplumigaleata]|uniref:ABC1-domain-containing protein n=1 Tax=Syncephalis pseudoplumigaleata TaxID=1712513 RepID=A0A4P9Z3V1_9FUNG|nr:ABC1-domain-containing protein [Syncephalis pseudoplumigaleata]|eukprot:RKP26712.1 ABC1-domain-containing protein [Syncephalis pseudoplumigaleata]
MLLGATALADEEEPRPLLAAAYSDEPPIEFDYSGVDVRTDSLIYRAGQRIHALLIEPIMTGWRFLQLVVIFLPCVLTIPVLVCTRAHPPASTPKESWHVWWYNLLARQMELAGPSFIKLAQWAATRVDIFPTELCHSLGRLHANNRPHAFAYTRKAIEQATGGRTLESLFEWFDETPVGVGAIAQVYRARLHAHLLPPPAASPSETVSYPSNMVAIKVVHPGIGKKIARDLRIMHAFAWLIDTLPGMKWLSLPDEVCVFGEMMNSQLDLRNEANNLERFKHGFRYCYTVAFPRPIFHGTSDVLIEEYIYALPMRQFLAANGTVYDKIMSGIGIDAFLHMLILDNFIHADLHPGNIFVRFARPTLRDMIKRIWSSLTLSTPPPHRPDPSVIARLEAVKSDEAAWKEELKALFSEGYRPRLVFLDAGLIAELNDKNRRNFIDLFKAIVTFDGYTAGRLMVERCRTPDLVVEPEVFALKMQKLIMQLRDMTFSLGKVSIGDILMDVLQMVREHHVRLEGDFANVVLSTLILEGIGRQLDPSLDIASVALAALRDFGRQQAGKRVFTGLREMGATDELFLKMWLWLEAKEWVTITWDGREVIRDSDLYMPEI